MRSIILYAPGALIFARRALFVVRCMALALHRPHTYAPHNTANAKARERYFVKLLPKINKRTILAGDFNCVLEPDLDLKRDSTYPYDNKGHNRE